MNVYIKEFNSCVMRKQKILQYSNFLKANNHTIQKNPENSDYIIIWTCGFRKDFLDASITLINSFCKKYTETTIIVAGCIPDIAPDQMPEYNNLILVPWKNDFFVLNRIFREQPGIPFEDPIFVENQICLDAQKFRRENPDKDVTFHDQFIKLVISEGCYFKCSYCSERLAFPPYKSFPPDFLYASLKKIVEDTGIYDVMLMADSLGQYGKDVETNFPNLVHMLKSIHPDIKFAFNNLNPSNFIDFFDDMVLFIRNGWIKHLNIPIQSGSDKILSLMQRNYTKKDIEKIFQHLRQLKFDLFDTHVIIGFPGETETDFEKTVNIIKKWRPKYILASKYMEARNAPSANLPNKIEEQITIERLNKIEKLCQQLGIICNIDGSELSQKRLQRMMNK